MSKKSTMKPFAPGDVLLGLTDLNDTDDDHAGDGRIVQYDSDLNFKGELWTDGGKHLVGGLEFDGNGLLWAFNDLSVIHVDPKTGTQLPLSAKFLPRCYRSASFDASGNAFFGELVEAGLKPM